MTSDANTGDPTDAPRLPQTADGEPGSVHVLLGDRRTRVVLTGEIDAGLGPDLLEAAAAAEDADLPVDVDAQHVRFMDSTGVAFLARLASRAHEPLVLIRPPAVVKFLVEVTSISELVRVVDADPGFEDEPTRAGGARPSGSDGDDDPDDDPDLIA
ncbi:STAS domain-containing protein [Thalassiella azotivora]